MKITKIPGPRERVGMGAMGFKINLNGKIIVNLGDSLFQKVWKGLKPSVLMIPISGLGDNTWTMDVKEAVYAVKIFAKVKQGEKIMGRIYNCTGHNILIPDIVKGDGIYLFDDKGKRYMDLESGVWCTSLGYKNIRINQLIKNQIDSIMHTGFCYSNNILQESTESVMSITNFKEGKCVFLCSGSEAIELARQISKHITQKKMSMTLHDSFLGSYSSVTDRSENWYIFNWEKCKLCTDKENCKINCQELQKIPDVFSGYLQ